MAARSGVLALVALLVASARTSSGSGSSWRNVTPQVCGRDYCDLLFPAQDYSPFVGYSFYVRVRLYLDVVVTVPPPGADLAATTSQGDVSTQSSAPPPGQDAAAVVDLTLAGAELTKEAGAAPAPGALPLGAFAIFLLKSADVFAASVRYGKGAVVGRARLPAPPPGADSVAAREDDAACHPSNRSVSCLESVELRQDLFESDTSKFTAYDPRYWRRLLARHVRELGLQDVRLRVRMRRDDRLEARYYVNPLVQGAPLTHLALEDVADIQGVVLGAQDALSELTVSGVDLGGNYSGLLGDAPNLRSLTLSHVGMTTPPPQLLTSLPLLESLDVSGNPGLDVTTLSSALPPNLTSLIVADCALPSVDQLVPPTLRHLDASGCSLSAVPTVLPPQLETLSLARNRLTQVPDDAFSSLRNLRVLNLSGNALTSLSLLLPSSSGGVGGVATLDLSHNSLADPAGLVRSGVVTSWLNLTGNPLKAWHDADAFSPWARRVDLTKCSVAFLTSPMRESLRTLDRVVLDGNPLDCAHCGVEEMRDWLRGDAAATLLLASNLRCSRPPEVEGQLLSSAASAGVCPTEDGGGPPVNLYLVLLPLGAVLVALGAAGGGVAYVYRYEITYIKHLVKLRSRRKANNKGGGTFQYDAFVCYSGNDRNWVMRKLLPELENGPERYRLCLHERDFILGSIIARNIVRFMQESRNTIVVLTDSFVKSQWCQWELDMANHKVFADDRDFLIFVELERLERRSLPRHLRYLMDTRTYLEWPASAGELELLGDEGALWRRLRTAMGPSIAAGSANDRGVSMAAISSSTASSA